MTAAAIQKVNYDKMNSEKCSCSNPTCGKCLSATCKDLDCKVHTKDSKIKFKKRMLQDIENQINKLNEEGVLHQGDIRCQMGDLRAEIDELEGKEPKICITYKYGFEPGASRFRHFIGVYMIPIFGVSIILIVILALVGAFSIVKWFISA